MDKSFESVEMMRLSILRDYNDISNGQTEILEFWIKCTISESVYLGFNIFP